MTLLEELDLLYEKLEEDFSNILQVFGHIILNNNGKINGRLFNNEEVRKSKLWKLISEKTAFLELPVNGNFRFKIWCIENGIKEVPLCKVCKIEKVSLNIKKIRFSKYCSSKCFSNCESVKNKKKKTNINKFGVEHPFQSETVKAKIKETNIKRYGVSCILKSKTFQNKIKITNLNKYGVENVFESDKIKEKIKNTLLEKYNVENISKLKFIKDKKKYKLHKSIFPQVLKTISKNNPHVTPLFTKDEYKGQRYIYNWRCNKCYGVFRALYNKGSLVKQCPYCFPAKYGKAEEEVYEFISSISSGEIIRRTRSVISPLELDIWIPELNLAFEYNGLYWHSEEQGCDEEYHLDKTLRCKEAGIDLIHIYGNEWKLNKEWIKKKIRGLLWTGDVLFSHSFKDVTLKLNCNIADDTIHFYGYKRGDFWIIKNVFKWRDEILNYLKEIGIENVYIINDRSKCLEGDGEIIDPSFRLFKRNKVWNCGSIIYKK